jgi:hypothetical protein
MYYRQPFEGEYPITQYYGKTPYTSCHTGIDYACPTGTPILASEDGTVVHSGWLNGGWGYCVIILHSDGNATLYAHLSECKVKAWDKVKKGQVIGLSGSTGNSTGPHLHFEARRNWNDYTSHFDPMTLPLHSVDDNMSIPDTEQPEPEKVQEGVCEVVCDSAWVRDWNNVERSYLVYKGTKVYVFTDVKYRDGLPFRYIGADRCMAEHDWYGTQILENVK